MSTQPLRFLIPKGRLFETVRAYLLVLGFALSDPDRRGFCGSFKNGELEFWVRKPAQIPHLLAVEEANRLFDAGITGEDMVIESQHQDELSILAKLNFSSQSFKPTTWVLACPNFDLSGWEMQQSFLEDQKRKPAYQRKSVRVGCERLQLAETLMKKLKLQGYTCVQLEGTEEAALEDGLCDLVICPVETGQSLTENKLKCKVALMESYPCILARSDLSLKQEKLLAGLTLGLLGADQASRRVMVKFDLPRRNLQTLEFPDYVISPSHQPCTDDSWEAVEVCIKREDQVDVLWHLEEKGAKAIVVQDVQVFLD